MIQSILENVLRARYGGKEGNMAKKEWWFLPESNRQPSDNEADALLTELLRLEATCTKKWESDLK